MHPLDGAPKDRRMEEPRGRGQGHRKRKSSVQAKEM